MTELEFSTPEIVTFWSLCTQERDTFYKNHKLKIGFKEVDKKSVPVFGFKEESDLIKLHDISVQDFVNGIMMARFTGHTDVVTEKIKKAMRKEPVWIEDSRRFRITLLDLQRLYFSLSTMQQLDTVTGPQAAEIRDRMMDLIYTCVFNINNHRVVCTNMACDNCIKKLAGEEEEEEK